MGTAPVARTHRPTRPRPADKWIHLPCPAASHALWSSVRASRTPSLAPGASFLTTSLALSACAAEHDAVIKPHYLAAALRKDVLLAIKKAEPKLYAFTASNVKDLSPVRRCVASVWSKIIGVRQHLIFSFSGNENYPSWGHGVVQVDFLSNVDYATGLLKQCLENQSVLIAESAAEDLVFSDVNNRDAELLCILSHYLVIYMEMDTLLKEAKRLRSRGLMLDRERERAVRPTHPTLPSLPSAPRTHHGPALSAPFLLTFFSRSIILPPHRKIVCALGCRASTKPSCFTTCRRRRCAPLLPWLCPPSARARSRLRATRATEPVVGLRSTLRPPWISRTGARQAPDVPPRLISCRSARPARALEAGCSR
jgi:hypothetical protein